MATLIVFGLWAVVIPESLFIDLIGRSLQANNLYADFVNPQKGLFYDFRSQSVILRKSGDTLLSIHNFAGRMNPFCLFLMKPTLSFRANIGGGTIEGKAILSRGKSQVHVRFDNLPIEEIPYLAEVGLSGGGLLSGELRLDDRVGDLRLSMNDVRLKDSSLLGITIPLDLFDKAQGIMTIREDRINISSLSLEGKGIYARVKGEVVGGMMDLTIEIMPDASLIMGKIPSFSMIENYKVSPGYYLIPIKNY